jgi:hypothetical protein
MDSNSDHRHGRLDEFTASVEQLWQQEANDHQQQEEPRTDSADQKA